MSISSKAAEAAAATSVVGALVGWLPHIAALLGIAYWLMKLCIEWEQFWNSKPLRALRERFKRKS